MKQKRHTVDQIIGKLRQANLESPEVDRNSDSFPADQARLISGIGWTIARQGGDFAKAESMLIEGFELHPPDFRPDVEGAGVHGMDRKIAAQRIVKFYKEWHGKSNKMEHREKAQKWTAKLAEIVKEEEARGHGHSDHGHDDHGHGSSGHGNPAHGSSAHGSAGHGSAGHNDAKAETSKGAHGHGSPKHDAPKNGDGGNNIHGMGDH